MISIRSILKTANIVLCVVVTIFVSSCLQSRSNQESFDLSTVSFDQDTYPVVILGGGIAGLTSAVYCRQANIPCLVIEGPKPGGALAQSHSVRNWPGILNAPGKDIAQGIRQQAVAGGAEIISGKVVNVDLTEWPRIIEVQDLVTGFTKKYKALSAVIALGTEPNLLGILGETGPKGFLPGVTNCAVCEGSLCKGKNVVVVGGGDAAITEADYLSGIAQSVTILVRKDYFRAKDTRARDRVLAKPNVKVMFNTQALEIVNNGSTVTGVALLNNKTNETSSMSIEGFFLAIGSRPNTSLFKGQLELDELGFIALKNFQETSVKGVFAAGDVSDHEFVQAVTAASDGCKSTLQAIKFLKGIGFDVSAMVSKPAEQPSTQAQKRKLVTEIHSPEEFEELVVNSRKSVFIDLYADMCIPCQQMLPIVEELARVYEGSVSFVKLNVSDEAVKAEELIERVGGIPISSVPTFILVRNGHEAARIVGAGPIDKIKMIIDRTF